MELYGLFALIPLSLTLAWQDWKSQQVNVVLALVTLMILALGIHHVYQSLWVFGVLWVYRYFRKNIPDGFQDVGRRSSVEDRSVQIVHEDRRCDDRRTSSLKSEGYSIQLVDIALFSFGAGYFSIACFSAYCLLTAIALVVLVKITRKQRLPFIVAWTIGFWGTYFLKMCIN